jgi:hypothetical protein
LTEERKKMLESVGFVWHATGAQKATPQKKAVDKIAADPNIADALKQEGKQSAGSDATKLTSGLPDVPPVPPLPPVPPIPAVPLLPQSLPSTSSPAKAAAKPDAKTKAKPLKETKVEIRTKRLWPERFAQLIEYKDKFGHTCVPYNYENSSLAKWVDRQRGQNKRFAEGRTSTMTQEKVDQLNDIGFVWSVRGPKVQVDWNIRFQQLLDFQRENDGSCLVPYNCVENPALGKWVEKQRSQYKYFIDGKPAQITADRIEALNRIGFVWSLHTDWKVRFAQLKEYKEKYNDCLVPHDFENKGLAKWNEKQRSQYKVSIVCNSISSQWDLFLFCSKLDFVHYRTVLAKREEVTTYSRKSSDAR